MKDFLKLANIWPNYRQNGDCFMCPHSPCTFVLKDADLAREVGKLVYYGQKLLLIVVMLTGRLMWFYYQQIQNCCRPVLTYWPDRLTPSVTDRLLIMYGILLIQLFFLWQLCTVDNGIFCMADLNNFLIVNCLYLQTFILKQCLSG